MDATTIERVSRWLQRRYGDRASAVSRSELLEQAQADGLPQDVQNILHGLPEGTWRADELERIIREALLVSIGEPVEGILP